MCTHKWNHKEVIKVMQGYAHSRSATYIQINSYFCEKCLEEKEVRKDWSGIPDVEEGVPLWVLMGGFVKSYK